MTHFSTNAAAYSMIRSVQHITFSFFSFRPFIKKRLKTWLRLINPEKHLKKQAPFFLPSFFFMMWLAAPKRNIIKTKTDCKQQHFLTRKQTLNPPIKPSPIRPAFILSGFFLFPSCFFWAQRQWCSLVNVRPVWCPRFYRPALTFCWAKNKRGRICHSITKWKEILS